MDRTNVVGIAITGQTTAEVLERIRQAEQAGIPAAWLTGGGAAGRDALTLFAAAAAQTKTILLGTSITQTWSRHPVAVAQQVRVLAELAPGRFRLGVGPGHRAGMERTYGVEWNAPLGHLREYLKILKALIQKGEVDFDGKYYKAHARTGMALDVPVMASALQRGSFELCGAEADGAISWVCPGGYLRDVAIPAIEAGAHKANRPTPALVAHTVVCVHENIAEVRTAAREQLGTYPANPFYTQMFVAAGFPEVAQTKAWSNPMLDDVVLSGNGVRVRKRLQDILSFGAREIIVSIVTAGKDPAASYQRTLKVLAQASAPEASEEEQGNMGFTGYPEEESF
ncbi:MAG: LLM class flavin-dependent oxidoreductase [Chloroflexota bacterium]